MATADDIYHPHGECALACQRILIFVDKTMYCKELRVKNSCVY